MDNENWVIRARKSKFIEQFPSQIPSGHWCPSFWYAKPVLGCSHKCKTCFMHRLRIQKGFPNTIYSNIDDLKRELLDWQKQFSNTMLCFGTETGDMLKDRALIQEAWKIEPEEVAYRIFADSDNKVLFCSKSSNVAWFYKNKPSDNVIISFSINGFKAAKFWEKDTGAMQNRLNAIQKLINYGWTVRVRVDPLLIDADFFKEDIKLIADFVNSVDVEAITSGVMRMNKRPIFGLQEQVDGIGYFFNLLSEEKKKRFMVCKANLEVIDILGLKNHFCNCMFGAKKVFKKTYQLTFF